jgi:predicted transposase YbfD/YdcC
MQGVTRVTSLNSHLSNIEDPRVQGRSDHLLSDILMIAIMAMLCGAEDFVDFEDFGKAKEPWLKTFLLLPHGIPSHDTFGRVFAAMDQRQFAEAFRNWTESLRSQISGEVVAIDGKTLRRSHDRRRGKSAIHMVSAWARDNGLVLGQVKVDEKSNEITAIPELLRVLELSGCIVTIDAMGTQKTIAREIRDADADYVLALKGNHEAVHEEVRSFFLDARQNAFAGTSHDFLETVEKDHGRIETRRYWVSDHIGWFQDRPLWEDLQSFGMVESLRDIDGHTTRELRFYDYVSRPMPRTSPGPCAVTGESKTLCTGASMSVLARMPVAPASDTLPKTSPSCVTSPSISSNATPQKSAASEANRRTPPGITPTFFPF